MCPYYVLHTPISSCEPLLCIQRVKVPLSLMSVCFTTLGTSVHLPSLPPCPPHHLTSLEFLEEDVGEEYQYARRQQPDHTLVDGDDVLQSVDALLHGVGVDVVINGGPDAPRRPYSIHQRFHSGRDH